MSNALVTVESIEKMAGAVAKSGLFGIKTVEQAMALMLIAQAEGLHPAIAARDYHVIQGRPALKADAMLARFQAAGGKVEWKQYTDKAVSAIISHPQGGKVEIEWTIEMAERAGLGKNPTWRQYPRQMLRARVISEGIRTVFPGVAVGVYTPEEVSDFEPPKDITPAKVEVVEAEVVEVKTQPRTAAPKETEGSAAKAKRWVEKEATIEIRTLSSVQALVDWENANRSKIKRVNDSYPEAAAILADVLHDCRETLSPPLLDAAE